MTKFRQNFTLSVDTLKSLEGVKNKSALVDKAIPFYMANQDKTPKTKEVKPLKVITEHKRKILKVLTV